MPLCHADAINHTVIVTYNIWAAQLLDKRCPTLGHPLDNQRRKETVAFFEVCITCGQVLDHLVQHLDNI